jgi:hypothetical protein
MRLYCSVCIVSAACVGSLILTGYMLVLAWRTDCFVTPTHVGHDVAYLLAFINAVTMVCASLSLRLREAPRVYVKVLFMASVGLIILFTLVTITNRVIIVTPRGIKASSTCDVGVESALGEGAVFSRVLDDCGRCARLSVAKKGDFHCDGGVRNSHSPRKARPMPSCTPNLAVLNPWLRLDAQNWWLSPSIR